jgi:hypothetical protein
LTCLRKQSNKKIESDTILQPRFSSSNTHFIEKVFFFLCQINTRKGTLTFVITAIGAAGPQSLCSAILFKAFIVQQAIGNSPNAFKGTNE